MSRKQSEIKTSVRTVDSTVKDVYDVGKLKITQHPERYILKNRTDKNRTRHNIAVYEHIPQSYVPEETVFKENNSLEISKVDELLRILASDSESPMLFGPAGTGKNTLIQHVCAKLNRPMYRKQSARGATVQDIIGQESLQNNNTATSLKPLGMAAVFGGVAIVDEINLASQRVNSNIMSITEKIGKRQIEIPGSGGAVLSDLPKSKNWNTDEHLGKYIHPECMIVATCNPASYSGAGKLNDALSDRFSPIKVSYLDKERESDLISGELDVKKSNVKPLVRLAHELREAKKQGKGSNCPISYRRLRDTVKCAKAHDITLYNAAKKNCKLRTT